MVLKTPIALDADAQGAVDGDAGSYLDELIESVSPVAAEDTGPGAVEEVELAGPHLRLSGGIALGRFRRLSDVVNHGQGLILLHDATVLRRNGTPTRVTTPSIWVNPAEITLIGQSTTFQDETAPADLRVQKEARLLIVVTPGHTLTAEIYIPIGGALSAFIESTEPAFIPITDVRARSLADRRVITRYQFALLNRRHVVAATEADGESLKDRRLL
ncbi:MAG TPA: hypothetical protein VFC71_06205 [Candidatus Polarisedimenticolia bacterium]|nr:hypothetical protein [Candidatus Polarisedimenticolia bacterium]